MEYQPQQWSPKNFSLDKNLNLRSFLGIPVISERGSVLGKVSEILVDSNLNFEGIFVKKTIFHKKVYFFKSYIEKISVDSIVLSIEPTYLLLGRKVITPDGEILGSVIEVERKDNTNEIMKIKMRKSIFSSREIFPKDIKSVGASIVLKRGH